MKLWVVVVVVVAGMAALTEAQFRFRNLPSPPEIIFGAFRPLIRSFLRSRPRPRPRPPVRPFSPFRPQARVLCSPMNRLFRKCRFLRLENLRPPPQTFQSAPPPPPSPPQQVFQSQPAPRPQQQVFQAQLEPRPQQQVFQAQLEQRPQQQVFQPAPRPVQTQRPFSPSPPDLANFGAPRPNSILNTSPQGPPRPSPQNSFSSQGFPAPLPDLSDNNIIGMTPPPPRARPQPSTGRPRPPQPPPRTPPSRPLTTSVPQQLFTSPHSNDVDELLVNPVPAVNAGVLPLANEKPQQPQLFPPLLNIR